jgi:hypothetical protein
VYNPKSEILPFTFIGENEVINTSSETLGMGSGLAVW